MVPAVEEQDGAVLGRGSEFCSDGAVPERGNGVEAVRVAAISERVREILTV
jgi:hypothetical protein